MIRNSSVLLPEIHQEKTMWMLIASFPDEIWMLQQPKEEIIAFFFKKKFSKLSDKMSSTKGSSATM